ncbi:response regulator [Rhodomicrobium sp. Az07]|uniref:PAS domain-containing hybrid sensor histidine kinase/response regulator n=1 Tax=Rhodomicrobium sp. Az07 TaxID=2839034 RepID=UPI001BE5FAC0|nr:ATP-binding protein [Rhodomicrobium sp. Az07]MBT3070663.1 response regulator [Rhodomicrobium sp. Az07]
MQDAVVVTDETGKFLWANAGFARLTGVPPHEIAARTPSSLLLSPGMNSNAVAAALLHALEAQEPVKTQVLGERRGVPVWFDLEVMPLLDADARIRGFVAIQRDITFCVGRDCDVTRAVLGSSKAEGRLRAAVEAISDGFAIYDENDRLLIANEAFSKLHEGIEDALGPGASFEELLRSTLAEGLIDIGDESPQRWLDRQLAASRHAFSEMHMRFANGCWMSRRHKRMENNETVRIWTDISSLKRQQAELEDARVRAESADRAKSQFLTNMSHEMRTPMNGIIGFNELLLQGNLSDTQRDYATLIQSSSKSLMSLIDEILDLGKIERGTLEIQSAPFKLNELISAARSLQALAEEKALGLKICSSLPSQTIAIGDAERIRQILVNLLGNAIKFTETGEVTLSIAGDDNGLALTVSDTGPGIAADRVRKIFNRFYQDDNLCSGKVQGSGLGLAIAKELTELMGGTITVASERGQGATFRVWLPLWLDNDQAQLPAALGGAGAEESARLTPCVYDVLVAEDHPINLKLALALLQAAGCETHSAENGQQVLLKLEKRDYDLIIMDSQMPIMNGVEAIRIIRHRLDWKRDIPILSLTADAMKGAEAYHASAGADGYMAKPLKSDCFISTVKRLAERGRDLRLRNQEKAA